MIEWLRNKFSSAISTLFVLTIIICTIVGAIAGNFFIRSSSAVIIGGIIGFIFGIVEGILTYGFCATVIHISESIDKNPNINKTTFTNTDNTGTWICPQCKYVNKADWNNCANCGKSRIEKIIKEKSDAENSKTWICPHCGHENDKSWNNCANCGKTREKPVELKVKDGYELIVRDGKTFAIVKDGNPDNYFCPNCYTQINPNFKTCVKCDFKF